MSFTGAKKSLVLNKTNASTLVSAFGDDTDAWSGRTVELFTVPVNFNGRTYDGVRVRAVEGSADIDTHGTGGAERRSRLVFQLRKRRRRCSTRTPSATTAPF